MPTTAHQHTPARLTHGHYRCRVRYEHTSGHTLSGFMMFDNPPTQADLDATIPRFEEKAKLREANRAVQLLEEGAAPPTSMAAHMSAEWNTQADLDAFFVNAMASSDRVEDFADLMSYYPDDAAVAAMIPSMSEADVTAWRASMADIATGTAARRVYTPPVEAD